MKIDQQEFIDFYHFETFCKKKSIFVGFCLFFVWLTPFLSHAEERTTKPLVNVKPNLSWTSLPKNIQKVFEEIEPDPRPHALARNSNYVVSNENHQERFYPALQKQQGGVFIGVGADQNYLLADWAKSEVVLLFDFDQVVVDLHKVYRLFFLNAKNKTEFLALWNGDIATKNRVYQWIENEYGVVDKEHPEKKQCLSLCKSIQSTYLISYKLVKARLGFLARKYGSLHIPTFVSDEKSYQAIVNLYQSNRVFSLRGDLSKTALCRVADALVQTKMNLSAFYLSNAENYFSYTSPSHFKECMEKMPTSSTSLILHTRPLRNVGNKYAYFVQPGSALKAWLAEPKTINFARIIYPEYSPIFRSWRAQESQKPGNQPPPVFYLNKLPVVKKALEAPVVKKPLALETTISGKK